MTEQEVRALLALAMSYDNRKFPGDANIAAWMEQANRNGWTFVTAREAIHQFHSTSPDKFLSPSHITAIIEDVRARIRKHLAEDMCPPPRELRDDPRAEIEWRRNRAAEYTQQVLDAWARGEELPELEQPALEGRERPQLGAALRHLVAGTEVPPEHRPAKP